VIYIDELLILNFIIDYLILSFTSRILKINVKKIKILLACLFGEISIIYLFIRMSNFSLIIFKMFIGLIMILIVFSYEDIKTYIKNVMYFYLFSFLLGGTLYYFKIENLIKYKYLLLLIPLFMKIYDFLINDLKNILTIKHKVTIYLNNGKILFFNGFMDTGNTLIDPLTNKKVIIINKKIEENYFFVPYKTLNDSSLMKCFKPKKVYIDGLGERNDILVGITNKKFIGFNCLLNSCLLEE
jgi:stage II sporulation protein GA (sporulation sigma-E factor processing peptidase)